VFFGGGDESGMRKQKSKSGGWGAFVGIMTAIRGKLIGLVILGTIGTGSAYGYYRLRQHIEQELAYPESQPTVVLKDRPAWMSDALAERIANSAQPTGARSALDHQLLKDIATVLQYNPWVREVRQVRRVFGKSPGDTIEIDCEYREPMALAAYRGEYILIDGQGYRLPERFPGKTNPRIMFGAEGGVVLRIIEGVVFVPPEMNGKRKPAEDLLAGLDLVKLLYGKPFADEIYRVNVANFGGRQDGRKAHLSLTTKYGTEIAWGRPVRSLNFELPAAKKLERLAALKDYFKRVDGGRSRLDIRNDAILQPATEKDSVVRANGNRAG